MNQSLSIFLLTVIFFKLCNQYKILLDGLQVEYVNKKYMDVKAGLYNINETTKASNSTITLKIDFPEDTKIVINAYRNMNNNYNLVVFHTDKRLKDALEMESFDVQELCLTYTRPPVVWPLKKNVPYRTVGWVPDASKYPLNVAAGRWKVEQILKLPNKTVVATANWFVMIEY